MFLKSRAALLAGVCCLAMGGPASAETLIDALTMAYETNPQLQARRAQLRSLDEGYVQARAGYRPTADLDAGVGLLNFSAVRPTPGNTGDQDAQFNDTNANVVAGINQPLYTGGRVTSAVRETEANILSAREQLRSLENDLFQSVIQAYVDVRRDEQSLEIRRNNVEVLRRQLEETRARFEVGEITRTDVAQAEARLAASQATLSQQQAQLATSRANYAAVVGQSPGTLEPEPALAAIPANVNVAYDTAQTNNPDLLAAELTEQASRARVARERAASRPSVGLNGRGSFQRDANDVNLDQYEAGATIGTALTLPLYRGGAISSRIRAARETNNADRINIETTRRSVVQQVNQSWNSLQAQRASLISNEEQVRAARIAFEGVQAEAQAGLRTTLDVLNAQAELREAELALVRARRDAYVAGAVLLNAMGLLEARQLTPGVQIYDPAQSFERIRNSNRLPWEPIVEGLDGIGAPRIEARPPLPAPTVVTKADKPAQAKAPAAPPAAPAVGPATPTTAGAPAKPTTTASLDALVDASLKLR